MVEISDFGRWLSSPPLGEEVVVTGVSGLFPSSRNVDEFQKQLFGKIDMVTNDRRWKADHPEIPRRGANIPEIEKFDAGYFGVHYKQAEFMDPGMRKFMETAIDAIVDAGLNPAELKDSRTGVFVGTCRSDASSGAVGHIMKNQKYTMTGYLRSLLAHRLSYYLKLKGPSFSVNTACSSSANAFENAFKSIRMGEYDNAIVGGVNLLLQHPGTTRQFFRLGVLSHEGKCRFFDEEAKGFIRADIVACVFLLKAKNSRRVHAQIRRNRAE